MEADAIGQCAWPSAKMEGRAYEAEVVLCGNQARGVALLGFSKERGHSCPRMCSGRMSRGRECPLSFSQAMG